MSQSNQLIHALKVAQRLGLHSWCIGAGAVRQLVWDSLHGFGVESPIADVDLVYYDDACDPHQDQALARMLATAAPGFCWDVTNQAHVHQWYARDYGQAVAPLRSLEEGIASWPEYATCVGVSLSGTGEVRVIAPYGLSDLFELKLRHNRVRASAEVFRARYTSKRWLQRWPRLQVVEGEALPPCA